MTARALLLAALVPLGLAFSDTVPIVAWSSHKSHALDAPLHQSSNFNTVLDSLLLSDDICDYDAVILASHPGLHASDLRTLPESSALSRSITTAPSALQLPYLQSPPTEQLSSIAEALSLRCNAKLIEYPLGLSTPEAAPVSKHVVCVSMPQLDGDANERRGLMADQEFAFSREIERFAASFPKYLVILAGVSPSSQIKRQTIAAFDDPFISPFTLEPSLLAPSSNDSNFTLPEGGILARYQLLTPGLLTTLLVAFFVIVPVVLLGVNALASIQSPVYTEVPKGFNAQERKNI